MNKSEIDRLLSLEKKVLRDDGELLDVFTIDEGFPLKMRIDLGSEFDDEARFLLDIKQSGKVSFKMTLHFMENNCKVALSRIDYYGNHQNPMEVLSSVPLKLCPYAGMLFQNENHIHYHVDGYSPLAWAMPLSDTDFPVKDIEMGNVSASFAKAIIEFARMLNIKTRINVQTTII